MPTDPPTEATPPDRPSFTDAKRRLCARRWTMREQGVSPLTGPEGIPPMPALNRG